MGFMLRSPSFEDTGVIPLRHTRRDANISPALEWDDPPLGTQSYVILMEDIDAPFERPLRHWIVYDIPAARRRIAEGRGAGMRTEDLPHARNDFGRFDYEGPDVPVSPGGFAHTYRLRLAALGVKSLGVPPQPRADAVWDAMRDYLLAEAELTFRFGASERV
jgi:Raf kinase inhibitor-like YbhB/YbcL family protein